MIEKRRYLLQQCVARFTKLGRSWIYPKIRLTSPGISQLSIKCEAEKYVADVPGCG